MARKAAYHKKRQNTTGMLLVTTVVIMMLIVVMVNSVELREKRASYLAREETLTEKIEEYEKYTQTKKYVEEIAKNKLGLVYEGEIIFKDEN